MLFQLYYESIIYDFINNLAYKKEPEKALYLPLCHVPDRQIKALSWRSGYMRLIVLSMRSKKNVYCAGIQVSIKSQIQTHCE